MFSMDWTFGGVGNAEGLMRCGEITLFFLVFFLGWGSCVCLWGMCICFLCLLVCGCAGVGSVSGDYLYITRSCLCEWRFC